MALDSFGPAAPWRWLQQAAALLRAQPRVLGGATALLLAVALVPSLVQAAPVGGLAATGAGAGACCCRCCCFRPRWPVSYRVVHALVQGGPVRPSALFAAFGDAPTLRRMVIANLLFVSGSLLLVARAAVAFGGEALLQFLRELSALAAGREATAAACRRRCCRWWWRCCCSAPRWSARRAGLRRAGAGRAPAAGGDRRVLARHRAQLRRAAAVLRAGRRCSASSPSCWWSLVAVLLGTLLSLLSPSLAPLLVLLLSLVLVLAMYALLFTFFYFAWRELFAVRAAATAPVHQIAA
jgi:hypothetical protein